jgi:ribosomal protein L18E
MSRIPLVIKNRKPDRNAVRSEKRERAAVALERIANAIRLDQGAFAFDMLLISTSVLTDDYGKIGESMTVEITWKEA